MIDRFRHYWRQGNPARRRDGRGTARQAARRHVALEALEPRELLSAVPPGSAFLTGPTAGSPLQIARDYLAQHATDYGLSGNDVNSMIVTDQYTDSAGAHTTHLYFRQTFNGLAVKGSDISVNITPQGEIINVGGSFTAGLGAKSNNQVPAPALTASQALTAASNQLHLTPTGPVLVTDVQSDITRKTTLKAPGVSVDDVPAHLNYMPRPDGSAALSWNLVIRPPGGDHWYDATVDATTGTILQYDDWVAYASYNVFALPTISPDHGPRTVVTDPNDKTASPYGWHDTDGIAGADFTDTRGNNVSAQEDTDANNTGGNRPDGGATLDFNFPLDLTQAPSQYQDAVITNLFYWNNIVHDVLYHYGFDENAGNFQQNNYGKGGLGNDAVQADAQDGSGNNNANFATPPDGQPGRMQMYVFNLTNPNRDGDLDTEIMTHEYGHGVSNRLTGGPANAGALQALQSGGMGEGWSDFFALMFTQLDTWQQNDPRPQGTYVLGQTVTGPGVRRYPYSYDMTVDPLTLNSFNGGFPNNEVHNAGEIWATVLWDMTWQLINKYGYDPDLFAGNLASGNQLAMQLVLDGMKLQPVNPSFLQARDAILQADKALTGGANQLEIWTAFARRGFGLSATDGGSSSAVVNEAKDMPVFLNLKIAPPVGLTENQSINDVTVATFTDPQNPLPGSSYQAQIDWGDGQQSLGTVVNVGGNSYAILGSTTYQEGGRYVLKVTLNKPGGTSTTNAAPIDIKDLPISATFAPDSSTWNLKEGVEFTKFVTTFVDSDPDTLDFSKYNASIDWGDGTTDPGQIVAVAGQQNTFQVRGTHTYGGGSQLITVTVKGPGGSTIIVSGSVPVEDNQLSGQLVNIQATEGQKFSDKVALFFDPDPRPLTATYYTAKINWGDNTVSDGTVVAGAGGFEVRGDHVFKVGPHTITVTINDGDISKLFITNQTEVANAPILSINYPIDTIEGKTYDGVIARFKDTNTGSKASDFSASIDWGDGTNSTGLVVPDGDGEYSIKGQHSFQVGSHPIKIALTELAIGTPMQLNQMASVRNAPLTGQPILITQTEGQSKPSMVALFNDNNPQGRTGDYTAKIKWGDGTTTDGTIASRAGGGFEVMGTHAYAKAGDYGISVLIQDNAGQQLQVSSKSTVNDAPLTGFGTLLTLTEKVASGQLKLGTFFDANPNGKIGEFTTTINWGDGTLEPGIIRVNPKGGYDVLGSHTYDQQGTYSVGFKAVSKDGSKVLAGGAIQVKDQIKPLVGGLIPQSDLGPVVGDWVTNTNQPIFQGYAAPGSTVHLYAAQPNNSRLVEVGSGAVNTDGLWRITLNPLADGAYFIAGQALGSDGRPSSPWTELTSIAPRNAIFIDTTAPTIQSTSFNAANGQYRVTFSDSFSGLYTPALLNPAAYTLTVPAARRGTQTLNPTSLTLDPTSPNTVIVGFNTSTVRNGTVVLRVNTGAIQDAAGNGINSDRGYLDFTSAIGQPTPATAGQGNAGQVAFPQGSTPPAQTFVTNRYNRYLSNWYRGPRIR